MPEKPTREIGQWITAGAALRRVQTHFPISRTTFYRWLASADGDKKATTCQLISSSTLRGGRSSPAGSATNAPNSAASAPANAECTSQTHARAAA